MSFPILDLDPPPDDGGWGPPEDWESPERDALDLVVESSAMMSVFAAEQYRRVEWMRRESLTDATKHGLQLTEVLERSVRLELAAALSITEYAAAALIAQADALVNRYPPVLEALGSAGITQRHATELADALDGVEPEFRDQLLGPALYLAQTLPVGTFRRKLRGLVETVRAVTLTERHERALQTRRVVLEPAEDSMAWLHQYIPAVEAHAAFSRLTAQAKALAAYPDETRTLDQLRADVGADLLIDGITDSLPPEARDIRATVVVTVPALALLGADPDGVATVEGVGPIPMARARELCGSAGGWTRVLTHPETGVVLSVGRKQYRPPPELRRLVRWRAETCMAPGCSIPATRCEIDHTFSWQDGGATALSNLTPLCKGHHILKHHGGWCVQQIPDSGGALMWTSPAGRQYRVEPERRVPVFTPTFDGSPPF